MQEGVTIKRDVRHPVPRALHIGHGGANRRLQRGTLVAEVDREDSVARPRRAVAAAGREQVVGNLVCQLCIASERNAEFVLLHNLRLLADSGC